MHLQLRTKINLEKISSNNCWNSNNYWNVSCSSNYWKQVDLPNTKRF